MSTAKRPADTSISANWEVRALRNLRHLRENEHTADDEPAADNWERAAFQRLAAHFSGRPVQEAAPRQAQAAAAAPRQAAHAPAPQRRTVTG